MHRFKHLITVLKHKHYVFKYARKLHIPWLGFKHDLSKFSYTEFHLSAKYYAGDKSPTIIERQYNDGVSKITMHHAFRNKHHWHYYVDFIKDGIIIAKIDFKHSLEYVADIISASRVYKKKEFNYQGVYNYFKSHSEHYLMHPGNKEFILWCVDSIDKLGFKKLKKKYLKENYYLIMNKYTNSILIPYNDFSFKYVDVKHE